MTTHIKRDNEDSKGISINSFILSFSTACISFVCIINSYASRLYNIFRFLIRVFERECISIDNIGRLGLFFIVNGQKIPLSN